MQTNEQLALKKSLYSARKTILFQFGTAVLSLILGLTIIYLFTKWAGTWNARFSDNEVNDFLIDAWGSALGLLFLIGYIILQQFEKALAQDMVFRLSIKSGFYSGIVAACIITFFVLLIGPTFKLLFLQFFYQITLLTLLGLLVGLLQKGRLNLEDFDPKEHFWLLSNQAGVNACKLHVIPYRHKVKSSWLALNYLIIITFLGSIVYIIWQDGSLSLWALFINVGIMVLFTAMLKNLILLIFRPEITTKEGVIEKQIEFSKWWERYSRTEYKLICQTIEYKTTLETWNAVTASKKYRLWISNIGKQAFAVEPLEENLPDKVNEYLTVAELKKRQKENSLKIWRHT